MIGCAEIQNALMSTLSDHSIPEDMAITYLLKTGIITPQVKRKLIRLLRLPSTAMNGLLVLEKTGYVDRETLHACYSLLTQEVCPDEVKREVANILSRAARKREVKDETDKWRKILISVFDSRDRASTQESIILAVRKLRQGEGKSTADIDTLRFFLDVVTDIRNSTEARIRAAGGLAEMGYESLVVPFLRQIVCEYKEEPWYQFRAMWELAEIDWEYTSEILGLLREKLENYNRHSMGIDTMMIINAWVEYLKEDSEPLVPLMLEILERERAPEVTWLLVCALARRGFKHVIVVDRLREWLEMDPQQHPGFQTLALVHLAQIGEITLQDLHRVAAENIAWDSIVENWLKSPHAPVSGEMRNELVALSHRCPPSPQTLLARVYLESFTQKDFEQTIKMLKTSTDIKVKEGLLMVLSDLWRLSGCHYLTQ